MNKRGAFLLEAIISILIFTILSTALFYFIETYIRMQTFEKKSIEAFRQSSYFIEKHIKKPPPCFGLLSERPFQIETKIIQKGIPLMHLKVKFFEGERLLFKLERIVECVE